MNSNKQTATLDLLIQGGKVVSQGRISSQWIGVKDEKIVALGRNGGWMPEAKETLDVKGKYVLPGIIDNEHHPSDGVSDLILAETRASISGGITTVGIETASVGFTNPPQKYP